jgi:hypothetical protein
LADALVAAGQSLGPGLNRGLSRGPRREEAPEDGSSGRREREPPMSYGHPRADGEGPASDRIRIPALLASREVRPPAAHVFPDWRGGRRQRRSDGGATRGRPGPALAVPPGAPRRFVQRYVHRVGGRQRGVQAHGPGRGGAPMGREEVQAQHELRQAVARPQVSPFPLPVRLPNTPLATPCCPAPTIVHFALPPLGTFFT